MLHHRDYMIKIHDFEPLFRPPTPPLPRPKPLNEDIDGAGEVKLKKSQLYVKANEILETFPQGYSIIFEVIS